MAQGKGKGKGCITGPTWTPEDDRRLRSMWGVRSVVGIASALHRSEGAIRCRAFRIGLTAEQVYSGFESPPAAADRYGISPRRMRYILRWWGASPYCRSLKLAGPKAKRLFYDSFDVDLAMEDYARSENATAAGKRLGVCEGTLLEWCALAGVKIKKFSNGLHSPVLMPPSEWDKVLAWRMARESVTEAAQRHGVSRHTIYKALSESGAKKARKFSHWFLLPDDVDRAMAERKRAA